MKGEKGVAIVDQGGTLDSSIFKQGIQVSGAGTIHFNSYCLIV